MIANNEDGRATETRSVTPPVVIATAGRGAVNHYLQDSEYLAGLEADRPLVCFCNNGAGPCPECRAEIDATLARIRSAQGLDVDEGGYFVDSRDGEARDEPEDLT